MIYCTECGTANKKINTNCIRCNTLLIKKEYYNTEKLTKFEDILTEENIRKLNQKLTEEEYHTILEDIAKIGIKNLSKILMTENTNWNELEILEKIKRITASYAKINYKNKGAELGNYRSNIINLDDRLYDSEQIATLIHELAHHLLAEIYEQCLMYILSVKKSTELEAIILHTLQGDIFKVLLNEYCAHTVEGRFIPHGYQNYGSFNNLLNKIDFKRSSEEIKGIIYIHMLLGNTFAKEIIKILELLIDNNLRYEIKEQFKKDYTSPPDYEQIQYEEKATLKEDEIIEFIHVNLTDEFNEAKNNIEELEKIVELFNEND